MKILFICTHNRCRSILAEAISRHMLAQQNIHYVDVRSAGSQPEGKVHPGALAFLQQQNIDTSNLCSQSWDEFRNWSPDIVITVCDNAAGESCPVWMGNVRKIHRGLEDPSTIADETEQMEKFQHVSDILMRRMTQLLSELHLAQVSSM